MKPCLLGVAGTSLSAKQQSAIKQLQPAGFILFSRNIDTPTQTAKLVSKLRELTLHTPLIMIDQEGGRVQRLGSPHWRQLPSAATIGAQIATTDSGEPSSQINPLIAAWAQEVAMQLASIGANCCAAPVLDLAHVGANQVIGDRAYGADPNLVAKIGRQLVAALIARAIIPVIKHLPGHGRASVDSHFKLGRIDVAMELLECSDFIPFGALNKAPVGMTAHLIYPALDPDRVFTQSPKAIGWLRNQMGFDGLLVSDCIHMQALAGGLKERADASLKAGVDLIIDSHSKPSEWQLIYYDKHITPKALGRLEAALAICNTKAPAYDLSLAQLLDGIAKTTASDPTGALY